MINKLLQLVTNDPRLADMETLNRVGIECRFPAWVVLFMAIGVVALAVYAYRREQHVTGLRRNSLTALRAVAYLALLFMLAAPVLKIDGEGRQMGPLPVVVDRTESMGIEDGPAGKRLAAALRLRQAVSEALQSEPALRPFYYLYGDAVLPYEDQAKAATAPQKPGPATDNLPPVQGSRTSLREMLTGGLREHRGGYCPGLLLIGDGANNVADQIGATVDDIQKRRIPVYVAAVGQEQPKDVSLEHVLGDDIVFVNDKAKFFVAVTQHGYLGKPLKVNGTFDGAPLNLPMFTPDADGDCTFPVEFTPPREGVCDLVLQIPPDSEESTTENNRVSRRVRVIKDKIRVLMVFGGPSWDFRFLNGGLSRDRRVEHHCYLQNTDRRILKYEQRLFLDRLPATRKELYGAYDIVIVSRVDMGTLPPEFQGLLGKFVSEEGGGLVVLSDGSDIPFSFKGTELEAMLPVRLKATVGASSFSQEMFKPLDTPYTLDVTDDGQGHPLTTFDADRARNKALWLSLPPVYELCTAVELKPSAIPLVNGFITIDGPRYPGIAYHLYGRGAVLYMGFDSTWRWRKEHGDRYFRDYWGKVVQFLGLPHLLGESAQARILLDRVSASIGDRVVVTASVRNRDYSPYLADSFAVRVRLNDGEEKDLKLPAAPQRPGIFRGSYYPDTEGEAVLRLPSEFPGEPVSLTISKISREFRETGVQFALLSSVTEQTGGDVFTYGLSGAASTNRTAKGGTLLAAARGPYDPRLAAKAERIGKLEERRKALDREKKPALKDAAFTKLFAEHIVKTIAEDRPKMPILIDKDLWDHLGLMLLAAVILCVEYLLRKLWYLD